MYRTTFFSNTVAGCGSDGFFVRGKTGTNDIKNNVSFENGDNYDLDSDWAPLNNASTSADGTPAALNNLTASANLKNPTAVWTNTDLRVKDSTADIWKFSSDNGWSPSWTGSWDTTFDEIDVPISDRNSTLDTSGNWTVGADDVATGRIPDFWPFIFEG